jgi:hypothetical protein
MTPVQGGSWSERRTQATGGRSTVEPLRDEDPKEIGGFALVCRIGSGGMGQVFLGESAAGHLP